MTKFLNTIKDFLITIIAALIFVFSICLCVEMELLFRCEKNINNQEFKMLNLDKFCTLDTLEKKLLKEPNNYIISIQLAQVYESLEDYKKANEFYKNALRLSNRSNMSLYYFALFCARHELYAMASTLSEELGGNSKRVVEYRARIYEAIGDGFMNQKEFQAATKAYQIAYRYAKNIPDKGFYLNISEKYSLSYAKLADYNIEHNETKLAVSNLENAIKIKETPQALYRLSLVQLNNDKVEAERIMHRVFKTNPYIINPYIYNKLLCDLIDISKENNNSGKLNYYSMKLNRFKKILQNSYVYKNDILIANSKINTQKKRFSKKKTCYLVFDVKNNTKLKIDKLYVQTELFINSRKIDINKKIVSKANPIDAFDTIVDVKIPLPDDINLEEFNNITLKYYARKSTKAPWTLLKIDSIIF